MLAWLCTHQHQQKSYCNSSRSTTMNPRGTKRQSNNPTTAASTRPDSMGGATGTRGPSSSTGVQQRHHQRCPEEKGTSSELSDTASRMAVSTTTLLSLTSLCSVLKIILSFYGYCFEHAVLTDPQILKGHYLITELKYQVSFTFLL